MPQLVCLNLKLGLGCFLLWKLFNFQELCRLSLHNLKASFLCSAVRSLLLQISDLVVGPMTSSHMA